MKRPLSLSASMLVDPRKWGALVCGLLLALLASQAVPMRALAQDVAGVVSNIAVVEWDNGATRVSRASNRVDIAVIGAVAPPMLALHRFAGSGGANALPITAPRCGAAGAPAPLAAAWQDQPLQPATISPTGTIRLGEPLVFRIDSSTQNRDPAAADTIRVVARASSGDEETLEVYETGPNTGVFAGYLQTSHLATAGDCRLTVRANDQIVVSVVSVVSADEGTTYASAAVDVLADPYGYVFDSFDGAVVSGARVTLINDATGQPALVFGDDGASVYPSTVVSGSSATDESGNVYVFEPGLYRFPLVRPGTYRLQVEPPTSYVAPSVRSAADMADLRTPGGRPFAIQAASFGAPFTLAGPEPIEIGIPLDGPREPLRLTKIASVAVAAAGDLVAYRVAVRNTDGRKPARDVRVTDDLPTALRVRAGSLRMDGQPVTGQFAADGRSFTVTLPLIAPGATHELRYIAEVKQGARPGDAVNTVSAAGDDGVSGNRVDAVVRIRRDELTSTMTVVGRITDGGCEADSASAPGVPGVRVMLEDGSYAVTDFDGRYHFEGVSPGTHVVQIDEMTVPSGRVVADCGGGTRSAGRSLSRFIDGRGGSLKRADFALGPGSAPAMATPRAAAQPPVRTDAEAAGAERDWLGEDAAPGIAWLFPEPEHNPRARLVRVAIKHLPGQTVALAAAGRPVDPVSFDGARKSADGASAVSVWRGIPLETRSTALTAEVRNPDGSLAASLRREVHYAASPIRAELLRSRSVLLADGVTRPILAVRFTDRDGRPVRHGLTGDFELPSPYYPAVEADAQQARQLAGLEQARPFWRVEGDEGVAYIALEPTTASGSVSMRFRLRDGNAEHEQRLEAWLDPGERPWTVVGLAEGTAGYSLLQDKSEDLGAVPSDVLTDGRLALYAKGRVSGKWLMTLAYDSDRREGDARFGGTIDPQSYYIVYADGSERRYDAASVRKLYLRLERPQFYALFGDYETGIDEPELARYVRAFNGAKAEFRSNTVAATAFAADTANRHQHLELQGSGLSGPYDLGTRDILANSERIAIEARDRLRSDRIVDRKLLQRHIDYDIDYRAGVVRFREPILSRDAQLNPQFIVADFEVDGVASRSLNAGGRVTVRPADGLQLGATVLRDADDAHATTLVGADVRFRPNASTELRAEVGVSDTNAAAGSPASPRIATAWQVEAEHHGSRLDLLAYAQEREAGFGVGQLSGAEAGARKIGVDAGIRITPELTLTTNGWREQYLDTDARRTAARARLEYLSRATSGRLGLTYADDRLADGRSASSTRLELGATQRLLGNRLELDAQSEIAIDRAESIDFPARHRLAARYALNPEVHLAAAYEIADGETVDSRTARLGFELAPWAGARIALSGNVQDIAELGRRSFAAYGLSQSLVVDEHWSVDFTLDGNRTIGGVDPARVLNPMHPVASGGYIGGGALTEDFTAVTAGATYRNGDWSATARAEYRQGDREDRFGITAAALRQIGEGRALGGAFSWFAARRTDGAEARLAQLQLSWAHRPAASRWSVLDKLELRQEEVIGGASAVAGMWHLPGATGPFRSLRMVNSLSTNFTAQTAPGGRGWEASLFWGARYAFEEKGPDEIGGLSNVVGADMRIDVTERVDVGLAGTVRLGLDARSVAWAGGPAIGVTPFDNGWLQLGWNVSGFRDRDFEDDRYTRSGPYVTLRLKFDHTSLRGLGL